MASRRTFGFRLLVGVLGVALLALPGLGRPEAVSAAPGDFERVSLDPNGDQLDLGFDGSEFSISENGRYVAFRSKSAELGVTNGKWQAFWHDRVNDVTTMVSVGPQGMAQKGVDRVAISADGQHVLFSAKMASGEDLDPSNEALFNDGLYHSAMVYSVGSGLVRRNAGEYEHSSGSMRPANCGPQMAISRDGSIVAMDCSGLMLAVAGETDLRVLDVGTTSLYLGSMSASGQWVTFESNKQLTSLPLTETPALYRVNASGGDPELVSIDAATGLQLDVISLWDSGGVADDGTVVMRAHADGESGWGFYAGGAAGAVKISDCNSVSSSASISPDASAIAFKQNCSGATGLYVLQTATGTKEQITTTAKLSGYPHAAMVSNNGEVVFKTISDAALIAGDTNGEDDLYVGEPLTTTASLVRAVIERLLGLFDWMVADPVYPVTGNVVEQHTDLAFAGQVFGMGWTRTFNGLDATRSGLGPGWSHSYGQRLIHDGGGVFTLVAEDGKRVGFDPDGSGGWESTPAISADLVETASGHDLEWDNGSVWSFNQDGLLTGLAAWDGQTVTVARDGQDRLSTVTSSLGHSLSFTFDGQDRLTGVTASDGRTVSYGYGSTLGGYPALTSVTDPTGGVTDIAIDDAGRITQITDPEGHLKVRHSYDTVGRALTQETPDGIVDFVYDDTAQETTVTYQATGQVAVYGWNDDGLVTQVTDPAGIAQTRSYDTDGRLTGAVDRRGETAAWTYDTEGRLDTVTDRNDVTTTYAWDSLNRPTSTTTDGDTTSFAYTGSSRIPSTVTDPTGAVTTLTTANGLVTQVVDADGVSTSYGYDAEHNPTTITDGAGNTSTIAYNATGQATSVTTPLGHVTSFTYDSAGRLATMTDPTGAVTSYGYNDAGQLETTTDPAGGVETRAYDSDGRLSTITDAAGRVTTHSYDADGQLDTVTNPAGGVTDSDHGTLGRLDSATDPAGIATSHTYNPDGMTATTANPAGDTWSTQYDPEGRPTVRTQPSGATTTTSYDDHGRVTATDRRRRPYHQLRLRRRRPGHRRHRPRRCCHLDQLHHRRTSRVPLRRRRQHHHLQLRHRRADRHGHRPRRGRAHHHLRRRWPGRHRHLTGGLVTSYTYDPAGRQTTMTGPDGGTTSYTYTRLVRPRRSPTPPARPSPTAMTRSAS